MKSQTNQTEKETVKVEELTPEGVAPGVYRSHNETLAKADNEVELTVEELEDVIAPGLHRNHNETLVRDSTH